MCSWGWDFSTSSKPVSSNIVYQTLQPTAELTHSRSFRGVQRREHGVWSCLRYLPPFLTSSRTVSLPCSCSGAHSTSTHPNTVCKLDLCDSLSTLATQVPCHSCSHACEDEVIQTTQQKCWIMNLSILEVTRQLPQSKVLGTYKSNPMNSPRKTWFHNKKIIVKMKVMLDINFWFLIQITMLY